MLASEHCGSDYLGDGTEIGRLELGEGLPVDSDFELCDFEPLRGYGCRRQ